MIKSQQAPFEGVSISSCLARTPPASSAGQRSAGRSSLVSARTSSFPPKVDLSLRYFTWMAMLICTGPHSVTVLVQQPEPGKTYAQLQRCVKVSLTAIEGASRTVNL